MQAVLCREYGEPENLTVENLPRPVPGPGQVLVEVHAVGLNFTDLLAIEGRSQLQRTLPIIPGCEASGIVIETGPGVTKLRPGERVLGTKTQGSYAEEVLFEENELYPIPAAMGFNDAAVFYVASMTARYAVRDRARLKAGEILLVLGAGSGAGLAAVEVGKALGARVVAAASSEDKLALARQSGADACVRYERGPLDLAGQKSFAAELLRHAKRDTAAVQSVGKINTVHEDAGYHVIFDGVGGSYAEPALRALGWEGRYLSVGFAAGMAKVALGPALFKNADIMGIQPSSDALRMPGRNPEGIEVMLRWYAEGRLHPRITKVLPLADAAKGLRLMKDRKATGRIVLETPRAGT